jgi:hypothetical protein
MSRPDRVYRIPVRLTKSPRARNKALLDYLQTQVLKANTEYEYEWVYEPSAGAIVIEVKASSHAEAYRLLCQKVRPGDARPIGGKTVIKHFATEGRDGP